MKDELLTIEEAAKKYKTSQDSIRRRIKDHQLPAAKPFGRILIKVEDLEKLFKKSPAA